MKEKFKLPVILPFIALAGAALSLLFTFLIGVTASGSGASHTNYIYHYFDSDVVKSFKLLEGASRTALRSEVLIGLLFSLFGLIAVLAFTGFTCYRAVKRYVYKNEEVKVEGLAVCTYLAYIVFAASFYAISGFDLTVGAASYTTTYNAATIVGLVLSTATMAGYAGCKIYLARALFKNKLKLVKLIYSAALIAVLAVVTGLASAKLVTLKTQGFRLSGSFVQIGTACIGTSLDEKLASLVSSSVTGYLVFVLLAIINIALIAQLFFSMLREKRQSTVFFAISLLFAALLLFFSAVSSGFCRDIFNGSTELAELKITVNFTIPITLCVFSVVAVIANAVYPNVAGAFRKHEDGQTVEENGDILLEVNNLTQHFVVGRDFFGRPTRYLKAVDGVSFRLKRGKTLGIVGESGCGKTTMGRTILRLYEPTGGEVRFNGKKVSDIKNREFDKLRPNMQMIFQDPYASLSPRLTVGEIIGEAVKQHKLVPKSEYHDYILSVMKMCGLQPHYFERYPHEFSGGQRQRICIARALALKPELVVCDEPVSALDVSIQAQIINMLIELRKSLGLTYIFISHDLSVVKHISDEVGVMYLGTLVEYGSKDNIFENTLHPYTKALFSAVPVPDPHVKMNRIILKGDIPSPVNPPSGCKFHTRCDKCMDICGRIAPLYKEVEEGHFCACHLYNTEEETKQLEEQYVIDCRLAAEREEEQRKYHLADELKAKIKSLFKKKKDQEDEDVPKE